MNLRKAGKSNKQARLVFFLKFNSFTQQNITINFTITGRQKRSPKNSKKKTKNKNKNKKKETQTNKQAKKSEIRKFNRLKTTGRTIRK